MKHTKDTKWEKEFNILWRNNPATPKYSEYDNFKAFIKSTLEEYTEEVEKVIENNVETNCTLDEDYVKRDLRQALHKLNAKFNILQGEKRLSKCCNAKIDYRGGGYDGEDVCPVEEYCTKCDQTLEINGIEVEDLIIFNNHAKTK